MHLKRTSMILYNLFDTDYALYNRSLALGLTAKHSLKVELLKKLTIEYKNSAYYDNALADLAKHYKKASNYHLAQQA